jgi:hypothetical protein
VRSSGPFPPEERVAARSVSPVGRNIKKRPGEGFVFREIPHPPFGHLLPVGEGPLDYVSLHSLHHDEIYRLGLAVNPITDSIAFAASISRPS